MLSKILFIIATGKGEKRCEWQPAYGRVPWWERTPRRLTWHFVYISINIFENFWWSGQSQGNIWTVKKKWWEECHDGKIFIHRSMIGKTSSNQSNSKRIEDVWVVRKKLWEERHDAKIFIHQSMLAKTCSDQGNRKGIEDVWVVGKKLWQRCHDANISISVNGFKKPFWSGQKLGNKKDMSRRKNSPKGWAHSHIYIRIHVF